MLIRCLRGWIRVLHIWLWKFVDEAFPEQNMRQPSALLSYENVYCSTVQGKNSWSEMWIRNHLKIQKGHLQIYSSFLSGEQ